MSAAELRQEKKRRQPPALRARCLQSLSRVAERYLRSRLFLAGLRSGLRAMTAAQVLQTRALEQALSGWGYRSMLAATPRAVSDPTPPAK
jgi:hypothetical protein